MSQELDIVAIIRTLSECGVEHVIVGGGAAVLHGAPLATSDLDIVYHRSEANVEKLLRALSQLGAVYRFPADKKIPPDKVKLMYRGHHLLVTKAGALDVLAFAGNDHEYPELSAKSIEIADAEMRTRVVDLETLIQLKSETKRPKDQAALFVLQALLDEKRRSAI